MESVDSSLGVFFNIFGSKDLINVVAELIVVQTAIEEIVHFISVNQGLHFTIANVDIRHVEDSFELRKEKNVNKERKT